MRLRGTTRRDQGFTIVELMVALTVGGLAITSMYAIGSATTRVFRQQGDIANAQTTLRIAMDQVKRDITRAGYLGTPNANLSTERCGVLNPELVDWRGSLAAISFFVNDAIADQPTALLPAVNGPHGFTVDEVVMFGNYSTGAEYPILRDVDDASRVIMQVGFYDARRDFAGWWKTPPEPWNDDAFNEAFAVGRAVSLRRPSGERYFDTIDAVPTAPTFGGPGGAQDGALAIPLSNSIPPACWDVAYISPLNAIRYFAEDVNPGAADAERWAHSGRIARLVRMEVQPGARATIFPGTLSQAVLDYVVAFNLAFTRTDADPDGWDSAPPTPDDYDVGTLPADHMDPPVAEGSTINDDAIVNANPERIRAVSIDLATRTPEQDPTFPWDPALCANQRCFRVFDDRPGAARVRKLHAEVFLPNVALGGY